MKIFALILLLFLSAGSLFAQESDAALASISCQFIHVSDTNNREQPRKEEMMKRRPLGKNPNRKMNSRITTLWSFFRG